jgi:hypothetical protein
MLNPARYVPIHIQRLAIKYGKRTPDPGKSAGSFRYEAPMTRLVERRTAKGEIQYIKTEYKIEVVVRESDWTIFHFQYF